jgi:hypothetical protein
MNLFVTNLGFKQQPFFVLTDAGPEFQYLMSFLCES